MDDPLGLTGEADVAGLRRAGDELLAIGVQDDRPGNAACFRANTLDDLWAADKSFVELEDGVVLGDQLLVLVQIARQVNTWSAIRAADLDEHALVFALRLGQGI